MKKIILFLFVLMNVSVLIDTVNASTLYSITELDFSYHTMDFAQATINDSGQIVGMSKTIDGKDHAFLYEDGRMTDLGSFGDNFNGYHDSYATGINNSGQIIGIAKVRDSRVIGGHYYSAEYHAFLYENGIMSDLGSLGGNQSGASAINNSGQIVGSSKTIDGNNHAFLYENGIMSDLGSLGGNQSSALAINNSGQIVGWAETIDGNFHAFLYENIVMSDLGLDGYSSYAVEINDSEQVVGLSGTIDGNFHAFLYENGVTQNIGTLGGDDSIAYAINNLGQVVGFSETDDGNRHAFLYENGMMSDLNDMLFSDWEGELSFAVDINAQGQILSTGSINGENHIFLLDPIGLKLEAPMFAIPDFEGKSHEWGQLESFRGFDPLKETVVIVHGWNRDSDAEQLPDWVYDMAAAMPDINVFAWNWQELAYGVAPGHVEDFVPGEAINLSRELANILGKDYSLDIQLIGHSLGSGIAARTAIYMQDDFEIDRLTLLDGPTEYMIDADVHLERLLGQINSDTFIENYASSWGEYYVGGENIANYGLNNDFNNIPDPEDPNNTIGDHSWVHEWYRETVELFSPDVVDLRYWGYGRQTIGDFNSLWYQTGDYSFGEDIGSDYARILLNDGSSWTETIITQADLDFYSTGIAWEYDGAYYAITNSPVYIMTEFFAPEGESYLSFDLSMIELHDGDRFELWLNDTLLYSVYADVFGIDDWQTISDINLSRWAGERVTLTFGLVAELDGVHSQFGIRNVNVYGYSASDNYEPTANAGTDQTVEQTGHEGAEATLDGSGSTDLDGDPLTYEWSWNNGTASGVNPTVFLPPGITIITLTVSDGQSSDIDTVEIDIVDTTPPEFTVSVTPDMLWPPNHKMFLITPIMTVYDNCDSSPTVELVSITMNEGGETNTYDPGYDDTQGDGHTIDDIQIDADDKIYLRAERSGEGDGRIYTLTYWALDDAGNSTEVSVLVTVPHDNE